MIWTRHILNEFAKVFFLVFFSLFFLGTLIDFSAHMKDFFQEGLSLGSIFLYYLAQLSRQGEIFLCVALLLANIKVLSQKSCSGEIAALCTAGVPLRRLTTPLLITSLVAAALLLANNQFIQPSALRHLELFNQSFFKKNDKQEDVHSLLLKDQSRLIYSHFDKEHEVFVDSFWVKDMDHIIHMQTLSPFEKKAIGVTILNRAGEKLVPTAFEESCDLPELRFESRSLLQATQPIEWQPLSQLFSQLKWKAEHDYEAKALSLFLQKLTSPLLALLVFLAPAPFCLRFGRNRRLFLLYAVALASFLGYIATGQALAILGKSLILSPLIAITLLPLISLTFFGVRYAKL